MSIENQITDGKIFGGYAAAMSLLTLGALIGNIVCFRMTKRLLHTKPSLALVLNLNMSDIIVALASWTAFMLQHIASRTNFEINVIVHKVFFSVIVGLGNVTLLTLTGLAGDCFIALRFPLHYKEMVTCRSINIYIIIIWICSTLSGGGDFLMALGRTGEERSFNEAIRDTIVFTGRDFTLGELLTASVSMLVSNTLSLVCLITMAFMYGYILRKIRQIQSNSSLSEVRHGRLRGEIRAVRTTLMIFTSFLLLWLPTLIVNIMSAANPNYISKLSFEEASIIGYTADSLLMVHSMVDAFIYGMRVNKTILRNKKNMRDQADFSRANTLRRTNTSYSESEKSSKHDKTNGTSNLATYGRSSQNTPVRSYTSKRRATTFMRAISETPNTQTTDLSFRNEDETSVSMVRQPSMCNGSLTTDHVPDASLSDGNEFQLNIPSILVNGSPYSNGIHKANNGHTTLNYGSDRSESIPSPIPSVTISLAEYSSCHHSDSSFEDSTLPCGSTDGNVVDVNAKVHDYINKHFIHSHSINNMSVAKSVSDSIATSLFLTAGVALTGRPENASKLIHEGLITKDNQRSGQCNGDGVLLSSVASSKKQNKISYLRHLIKKRTSKKMPQTPDVILNSKDKKPAIWQLSSVEELAEMQGGNFKLDEKTVLSQQWDPSTIVDKLSPDHTFTAAVEIHTTEESNTDPTTNIDVSLALDIDIHLTTNYNTNSITDSDSDPTIAIDDNTTEIIPTTDNDENINPITDTDIHSTTDVDSNSTIDINSNTTIIIEINPIKDVDSDLIVDKLKVPFGINQIDQTIIDSSKSIIEACTTPETLGIYNEGFECEELAVNNAPHSKNLVVIPMTIRSGETSNVKDVSDIRASPHSSNGETVICTKL